MLAMGLAARGLAAWRGWRLVGRGEGRASARERESEKERARVVEYSGQAGRQASGQAGSEEASRQGTASRTNRASSSFSRVGAFVRR